MRLEYDPRSRRYEAYEAYRHRERLRDNRFRWNGEKKCWWTPDAERAALFAETADEALRIRLEQVRAEAGATAETRETLSRATVAHSDAPAPPGLAYLPYQKAGIEYALARQNTLIADEMGLGKTIQALGVVNATPDARRILVICPASLRLNWRKEAERWLVTPRTIGVVERGRYPDDADVVIVNYDVLRRHEQRLRATPWDVLIADESHYLKNPKAIRTKVVLGERRFDAEGKVQWLPPIPAARRLFLTGTPMLNRPIELWPMLRGLDPERWHDWRAYVTRYCAGTRGRFGWITDGASHLAELQKTLRATLMIRRRKDEVLTELPAKRHQIVTLAHDGLEDALADERDTNERTAFDIETARLALERLDPDASAKTRKQALSELRRCHTVALQEIAKARMRTSLAKLPAVLDALRDGPDKCVVFAHHHRILDALAEGLVPNVTYDGRTAMKARERAIERFQNDPEVRFFIGAITAAGVGITLTAASHVVFAELDWTPATLTQAEDRCHRIGQHHPVLVQHYVVDGSTDAWMAQLLLAKQQVLDAGLDDPTTGAKVAPLGTPVDPETQAIDLAEEARAAQMEEEAKRLTPRAIARVHADLKRLAGACDGARERDDAGFNAAHAALGHALAETPKLTPRQAVVGQRITRCYPRQLGRTRTCRAAGP